jgi:hypothetical protein
MRRGLTHLLQGEMQTVITWLELTRQRTGGNRCTMGHVAAGGRLLSPQPGTHAL